MINHLQYKTLYKYLPLHFSDNIFIILLQCMKEKDCLKFKKAVSINKGKRSLKYIKKNNCLR